MAEIIMEEAEYYGILARQVIDDFAIPYRKSLNAITGGVLSTILLQQILYRYKINDFKPFYKFKMPCSHKMYKKGDSWTEELGFSRREFDTALSKIAHKVKSPDRTNYREVIALVYYWNDLNRLTWFEPNLELIGKSQSELYIKAECASSGNGGMRLYEAAECASLLRTETLKTERRTDNNTFAHSEMSERETDESQVENPQIGGGPPNPLLTREGGITKSEQQHPGFAEFWSAYPRKKAKPAAYRAWAKQKCESIVSTVLDAVKVDKSLKRDDEFIPYPASWLNQRSWEDEGIAKENAREAERTKNRAARKAWEQEQLEKKNATV